MTTVAFLDEASFRAWHEPLCASLGIPYPGYVGGFDEPALENTWTTAYVEPKMIDGRLCVTLDDSTITSDPILSTLEVVEVRIPSEPGSDVDENGEPISVIEPAPFNHHLPIPESWTDESGTAWSIPESVRSS